MGSRSKSRVPGANNLDVVASKVVEGRVHGDWSYGKVGISM